MPLVSCAVYVSSGVSAIAARVAATAASIPHVAVIDTFTDAAYARSSVKMVAEPGPLLEAAKTVASEALSLVDLAQEPHPAPHPRVGAVDMVSFMPLSERCTTAIASELALCDGLAWKLGERLGSDLGTPVLMYGERAGRTLLQTRRGTSFFASCKEGSPREVTATLPFDFGTPGGSLPQRSGVSVIGAQPYVTNFNIQVENASLDSCRGAAAALRSEMGVQVMALPHADDVCEIGCNLQADGARDSPAHDAVMSVVRGHLPEGASIRQAYVVGFTPAEALTSAERMLCLGQVASVAGAE